MLAVKQTVLRQIDFHWHQIRRSKLFINAGLYISGNVVQKAFVFLLTPVWARFLTPEDYGITGTLTIYGGVLLTLFLFGLNGSAVRHYYEFLDNPAQQKSYITSIVFFQAVLPGVVVIALSLWGEGLWVRYLSSSIPFNPYVQLMLWSTYALSITQIPLSLYQAQQKAREFVYIQYGKFVLEVAAIILFVVALQWRAYGVMVSQLVVSVAAAVIIFYLFWHDWFTWRIHWQHIRMGLVFGFPLVPHAIFAQILLAADRFILERFVSLSELGLYNVGYLMGMALLVLVGGINQAWTPFYFKLMKENPNPEEQIIKLVSIYISVVGGVCLLGILFVGEAVYILMPTSYYGAVPFVAPILFGYLLLGFYYIVASILLHFDKTIIFPLATGTATVLNVVLNLYLIPIYGAIAAAWTTTATQGVLFLIIFFISQKYQQINFPLGKYSLVVSIIFVSTLTIPYLGILDGVSLLIKLLLVLFYAITAYLLLVLPLLVNQRRHSISNTK